ncbi:trichohyalin-like [Macrobrachium nipponense]|uniref:trichohyalin-like n=1 Tax=Macrobrachium nipponense TaxID=159736 RepID=UPI0030C8AEFF
MSNYFSMCSAFVNDLLARIPLVGIGITSNLYEYLQPDIVASFLRRNWFAAALTGIGGILYSHLQKERVARRRAEDDNLKSRVALDLWQNVSDIWETLFHHEEQKNVELRKDIGRRKEAEEALRQRVCDLEKSLADEKMRHLEELLDMEEAAEKQIQLAEEKFVKKDEEASYKISLLKRETELYLDENKKLDQREHDLIKEIATKAEIEASLQRRIESLEGELADHRDLKKLNEEQTLLILRQAKENEELKQLESGYKELKNELATFAREKDLLRRLQEQETLEGEIDEKSRIVEMEEELRELRHSLTLTNSDRDRLREEEERLREIIEQKETEYIELEREVKALENVNQELVKDIYLWDRNTVAFEQRIEDLQGVIDDLMRRNVELSKLNMEMEGKNALQEKKLQQEPEALLKEPSERAGHATEQKEKLEGEIDEKSRIGEMEEELRELRHSLTLTNSDKDRLREEKERLQEIIEQKETEYIELEREVKALENVNQELVKDIYQWDRNTVAFEQTIEELRGTIDDLRRRNVELNKLNMEMEGKNTLQEKKLQQQHQMIIDAYTSMAENQGEVIKQKRKGLWGRTR